MKLEPMEMIKLIKKCNNKIQQSPAKSHYIMKNIQQKLKNNLTLIKLDKSKSIVVIDNTNLEVKTLILIMIIIALN